MVLWPCSTTSISTQPGAPYLQEADRILNVSQQAQIGALPAQPLHLLLQPVYLPLHLAAQGGLMVAKELPDLCACEIHVLDHLCKRVCVLLL